MTDIPVSVVLYTKTKLTTLAERMADGIIDITECSKDQLIDRVIKNRWPHDLYVMPNELFKSPLTIAAFKWPQMEFVPSLSSCTEEQALSDDKVLTIIADEKRLAALYEETPIRRHVSMYRE